MAETRDGSGPWGRVVDYLRNSAPAGRAATSPQYVLDSVAMRAGSGDVQLAGLPMHAGGATTLGVLRKQQQQRLRRLGDGGDGGAEPAAVAVHIAGPGGAQGADAGLCEQAAEQLRAFSREEAPDPAQVAAAWRLPSATLAGLCDKHLSLDSIGGSALAGLIHAVASDAGVSLENQQLVLRRTVASRLFGEEAIPAVVQSQVVALAQSHPQVAVAGLLVPLLERLSQPAAGLVAKAVRSGMPAAALAAVWSEVAAAAGRSSQSVDDSMLQVMEALVSATPAEQASAECLRSWVVVLHGVALRSGDSKKLGALMLHFVNKFGGRLDAAGLDLIAAAAAALTTSLKKAVLAAASRKKKS
ncbi:hypothetical protein LPJ61_002893 [Coemansia biformis]|uniref:Fanconi Anaemia group E protein C-terminal domain-containing protein n=1 Tax=Coemansia biformis TaxID=1286918 RepID=A0A9W8CWS2_9FUNG|nr:hypothetical protein LPJ61_002893 [Coemansia biformis]